MGCLETYQGKAEINQRGEYRNTLGISAGGDYGGRLIADSGILNRDRCGIAMETEQVIISLTPIDGRVYFRAIRMIIAFRSALRKCQSGYLNCHRHTKSRKTSDISS
jgi:hypothetical protein